MVPLRFLLVILVALPGCPYCDFDTPPLDTDVTREKALDEAFHLDPRWLGGDAAYTIDLGDDTSLWLFGDSFIATSPNFTRSESTMVRNSVALMGGRDLATASMQFAWRDGAPPTSFFPEDADHWFWPNGGVRVPNGPLLVFLSELRATPGEGLGFAGVGMRALRVADPSGSPLDWTLEPTTVHSPAFAPTMNVSCSTVVDDKYLIAVFTGDGNHDGMLARWPLTAIANGDDLGNPEWWTGTIWLRESFLTKLPKVVIPDGGSECSLHYDTIGSAGWVYTWSRGFGDTTIAMRTAWELTGPWSDPFDIFTPPESKVDNAFVYAAKAHPALIGPNGGLIITFADNSFTFADLFDAAKAATLYWPHVVEVLIYQIVC
ncbi:MAG TPA: hypothetical protein VFV99_26895 [Kofleriaceae bacterium]|nr:hypothetical protein [Kofleriaceae bacterium]